MSPYGDVCNISAVNNKSRYDICSVKEIIGLLHSENFLMII